MDTKLTMSVEEMGAELGISRPLAYELAKREGFPAIRIGRRIRISRDGLQRWVLEAARANPGGAPVAK